MAQDFLTENPVKQRNLSHFIGGSKAKNHMGASQHKGPTGYPEDPSEHCRTFNIPGSVDP